MKILIVDFYSLKSGYGGELWIKEVSKRLSKNNEVTVLTSTLRVDGTRSLIPTTKMLSENHKIEFGKILKETGAYVFEFKNIPYTTFPNLRGLRNLFKFAKWADVIYFLSIYGGLEFAVIGASVFSGTPVICGHHSPLTWYEHEPNLRMHERAYFRIFGPEAKRLGKMFRYHHVLNNIDYQKISKWKVMKVFKIPNGMSINLQHPQQKYSKFTILFLGRFDHHKGADLIPSLVGMISRSNLNVEFHIAGRGGPQEQELRDLEAEYRFVKFLGYLSDDDKEREISRSHVLIMLSRYEGFPMVALESVFLGTPVIGFPIEGITDLITDGLNGFIVTDLESLMAKISFLVNIEREGHFSNLSQSTISVSKEYDWVNIFPKIEAMFSEVKP